MTRDECLSKIATAVAAIQGDPTLASRIGFATDLINEIGLDSLKMTDFILGLEDDLGISIDFDIIDYETFTRVERLVDFLSEAVSQSAPMPAPSAL